MATNEKRVGDYMTSAPQTIGVEHSLLEAARQMREGEFRHLPVMKHGEVIGVVSDRDIAWVEALEGPQAGSMSVTDAMTGNPYVVAPNASLRAVARQMVSGKYGSAVVVESGEVRGIFTAVDAMRALVDALA